MKKAQESNKTEHTFIPNSVRFLSSCLKIVSSNVRSAGASVAGSISGAPDDHDKSTSDWKTERYKKIIKSGNLVGSCAAICYMAIWVGYTDVHLIFSVSKTLEHVQLSRES